MPNVTREIRFKTARSGGKGGQNVNKVETLVEGLWDISKSRLFSDEEKSRIIGKLKNRVNASGILAIRSSEKRTQLENKENVIRKINEAVKQSLVVPRKRKATKPSVASKEKRIASKKRNAEIKTGRKKISGNDA
ncbi:MAG: aminoacyl-tRNA hydrolase [Chitinophagaceae bacterium]|nr:aminoacyl-tRNA hydrolase [Bacteroidota bacterium]MCC6257734.1 aminoacyl-tRNA hydrolase [Chitinophagaceae bacterium]MCW5915719.1 aminoacyl-tRNA hydrolase [Ferruginibacter sp.]